jgi:hypothetical protein
MLTPNQGFLIVCVTFAAVLVILASAFVSRAFRKRRERRRLEVAGSLTRYALIDEIPRESGKWAVFCAKSKPDTLYITRRYIPGLTENPPSEADFVILPFLATAAAVEIERLADTLFGSPDIHRLCFVDDSGIVTNKVIRNQKEPFYSVPFLITILLGVMDKERNRNAEEDARIAIDS